MTQITQAPALLSLKGVAGNPFGLILNVSLTDASGEPIPWSEVTAWTAEVVGPSGGAISAATPTISSPETGQLSVSWSAVQTAIAVLTGTGCDWVISATINGSGPYAVLAGSYQMVSPPASGQASTATEASLSIAVGTSTVDVTVQTGGVAGVDSFNGRVGAVTPQSGDYAVGQVTGAAPLASPALTGTPTAPTQTTGDNSTKIATDAFVTTAVAIETTRAETAEALALAKASNLSDVADAGSSRWHVSISALSSAAAVATSNVSLSAPGATIDGYSLQSNDEVLLTAQSTASQNGIWIWSGASSALVRPNEFPSGGVVKRGRTVTVVNGTLGANTEWLLAAPAAGLTIDTTAQTWTRVGTGTYVPSAGPFNPAGDPWFSVKNAAYGAKGNVGYSPTGAVVSGQNTLIDSTASFTAAINGSTVYVPGAGTAGATWIGTATYVSPTEITLSTNAGVTGTLPYYVVGSSTTDDTTAIDAAIAAANAAHGTLFFDDGVYLISSSLTAIACNVIAGPGAQIVTIRSTIDALTLGSTTTAVGTLSARLPQVVQLDKTWGGTDIGVRLANLFNSEIHVPGVSSFSVGLQEIGMNGIGCGYNSVFVGILNDNQINEQATTDGVTGSYCNEWNHFGGRYTYFSGDGTNVAGTRHIQIPDQPYQQIDSHRWWGPSLEGDVPAYHYECYGSYNYVQKARWDTSAESPKVHWGKGTFAAGENYIDGGYKASSIVQTFDAGTSYNSIINSPNGNQVLLIGGTTGVLEENESASSDPIRTIMPAGALEAGTAPSTGYLWQWSGTLLAGKQTGDTYPRIELNPVSGQVLTGNGAGAPTALAAGAMALIASNVLASPASSVTFSSIAATYNHLRLVIVAASSQAAENVNLDMQFNGDTSADYQSALIFNSSASAVAASISTALAEALLGKIPGTSATAGVAGVYVVDIPLYAGTTFFKALKSSGGYNDAATATTDATIYEYLNQWNSTAAINAIKVFPSAGNFITGSAFFLYGVT